jgi:hypothetical protein
MESSTCLFPLLREIDDMGRWLCTYSNTYNGGTMVKTKATSGKRDPWKQKRARLKKVNKQFDAMTPEERVACIPVDLEPTEFEIQAFLFESIKRMGVVVRGEVASKCGTCVFDLVVYVDGKPAHIIECKKRKKFLGSKIAESQQASKRALQINKYSKFGLPLDVICGMEEAVQYVAKMSTLL